MASRSQAVSAARDRSIPGNLIIQIRSQLNKQRTFPHFFEAKDSADQRIRAPERRTHVRPKVNSGARTHSRTHPGPAAEERRKRRSVCHRGHVGCRPNRPGGIPDERQARRHGRRRAPIRIIWHRAPATFPRPRSFEIGSRVLTMPVPRMASSFRLGSPWKRRSLTRTSSRS